MRYVLGIDIGTSGTKTVLFNEAGGALASATREYPLSQPCNGWAEQSPEDWWNAVVQTIREVLQKAGVAEIAAVGLSGQMHGLVMLDENGQVLRPAILWCDQRTQTECSELEQRLGRERLIAVSANPALTGFTAGKLLWVKKHEPALFEKCRHVLLPKDYIRYRLTGEFATEVSDASGMQLLDVPNRCWSEELLDAVGLRKQQLGKVYESPEITGVVSAVGASATGLRAGVPVVGGAGDNAAAAVGTGVVEEGTAFTTIGTSGVVYAHTDRVAIDPAGRVHTFCCAVPGAWHIMGVTQAAGLSLRWFRDCLCEPQKEQAAAQGRDAYELLCALAAQSPVGANRLLYLPYLMGERTPHLDPNARGAFIGLSAMHTRADLIRAVLEGVCFSLRDCLSVFAQMNILPSQMRACGGGARSPLWRQMLADVYNLPICTMQSEQGPALGVAILAMVGAGIYPDVKTACRTIIHTEQTVLPHSETHNAYALYYRLYGKLYRDLENSFQALSQISGNDTK